MPTLTVDGQEITVKPGTTVLQACEQASAEVTETQLLDGMGRFRQ